MIWRRLNALKKNGFKKPKKTGFKKPLKPPKKSLKKAFPIKRTRMCYSSSAPAKTRPGINPKMNETTPTAGCVGFPPKSAVIRATTPQKASQPTMKRINWLKVIPIIFYC